MNKTELMEMIHLYLMDELNADEKLFIEDRLMEDDELQKEFNNIKSLYTALTENRPKPVSDRVLNSARTDLMRKIRTEESKTTVMAKITDALKTFFTTNYKYALSGAATMVVGIFIGYIFFTPAEIKNNLSLPPNNINVDDVTQKDIQISNIRFPNPFSDNGDIEISFDAIKPISYKGKLSDPVTQRLLATALVTEQNPGLRLKTVSSIASQTKKGEVKPDPKVENALITTLKVDDNPAVRKEALNVLVKYPFDEEIRDALLFVLSNDKNSGMRVSAINALADLKLQGTSIDDEMRTVLNNKAQSDDNDFIRLRAASLLKEVR